MNLIISTGCIIDGRYLELWAIIICFCRLVGYSLLRWSGFLLGRVVSPLLFAPPNFVLAVAMVAIKGDCKWGCGWWAWSHVWAVIVFYAVRVDVCV